MSAHTPGPWTADESESGATTVRGPDSAPVALVSMAAGHANARLIAAAPDLLAALKRMGDHWLGDNNESMRDAFIQAYPESAIAQTVAAISKAESR